MKIQRRRGAVAVLAMLFLILFSSLAIAMYATSTLNTRSAHNLAQADKARSAAESGLRWMAWRFVQMARPKTTKGVIDAESALTLWPSIKSAIVADSDLFTDRGLSLTTNSVATDSDGSSFKLTIRQNPDDPRYIFVTSTGSYGQASKVIGITFKIDKKVKFAIVGKVPIQLGRNTLVEGPVASTIDVNGKNPLFMLSDFRHLTPGIAARIDAFNAKVEAVHRGFDNRISTANPDEFAPMQAAGFEDLNGDAFVDEYDLFLDEFDADGDTAITSAEFTNPDTGELYDADLFGAIDALGGPLFSGQTLRSGYQDGRIDNSDAYAKIRGQIILARSASEWTADLDGQDKTINDMIKGPIQTDDGQDLPILFNAIPGKDIIDLDPANFEEATQIFKAKTGPSAGAPLKTGSVIQNSILSAADANGGTVDERTPSGSTAYQATYRRPKFQNMTFKNVQIPKGLNALFENCTFEGVTYVDSERNILTSGGTVTLSASEGMNWSKRKVAGDSFTKDKVLLSSGTASAGTSITAGSQNGNNVRFQSCTFRGPVAGNYATAYTHFANSWEFTGNTLFDNQVDETATIVSPQVNIEMGSFTNPGQAPSKLIGVVVAGNFDIRGTGLIDGSIIVTGDGAGNSTHGWFGPSDASTETTSEMPEGGWGQLNIRYNPYRPLPDGINVAIDILPEIDTYVEHSL